MKKLDWLVVKSFIGPFVLTFFIALFVLVMQFLWKYVDELVGKGLNVWVLSELLFYASARLVPMALPLAMLLASIMTYGSFGEHYELTAVKSAGISLLRFMRPLFFTAVCVSVFAFFFSNNLLPLSNLKFQSLLHDIRNQKPSLALKPKMFYSGLDNFMLRVEEKRNDSDTLYGLTVYDHTANKGNDHVILAEKALMEQHEKDLLLKLNLINGRQYREVDPKDPQQPNKYEMVQTSFATWEKRFDMSQFQLNRTDENFYRDLKQMLNLKQLTGQVDTIYLDMERVRETNIAFMHTFYNALRLKLDSNSYSRAAPLHPLKSIDELLSPYDAQQQQVIMERALNKVRNIKNYADSAQRQLEFKGENVIDYLIEIYRKFTLSIACLVLFFIGAPLGSIIRKGGLGWPLFYAVLLFIVYHVSSMMGEKLAEKHVLTVFNGMWLSTYILLPLGLFLAVKATQDSKMFSGEYYALLIKNLFSRSR